MSQTTLTLSGTPSRVIDKFLTPALNIWILSKISTLHWICLLFILLILVGVELPLCIDVALSYNAIDESHNAKH